MKIYNYFIPSLSLSPPLSLSLSLTHTQTHMGSTSTSKDSLNGLKFGQGIYFEDVGIGAPVKSGGGSSSAPPPEKKGGGPRCQVEGCRVDLSEAKAYYGRHKVCRVHSKTPVVVVDGIQQRFCQQCSRFHQLPEFDQGKRSCRRRLAGHNERRRKPPPRSLFSSPYGRLPSTVFETGKGGRFLMNFSMYPKQTGRHTAIKEPNHSTTTGKSPPNLWHNGLGNVSSTHCLQSLSSGIHDATGSTIPSGDCFTGASNSSCALSLLSNQLWGPGDGSSGPFEGAQMGQLTKPHRFLANQFSDVPRGFQGLEDMRKSKEIQPHLDLSQIAQPSDEIGPSQRRQYVELEHLRTFDSSIQYMNWSL